MIKSHNIIRNTSCSYCSAFWGPKSSERIRPVWNTVLYESDNFIVVPTKGAIVEGWLLLISKKHYLCMGALPTSLYPELRAITHETIEILTRSYAPPTIFEHGPSSSGLPIGCGVDHAHFHVVPLSFSMIPKSETEIHLYGTSWVPSLPNFNSLRQLYDAGKSYLYLQEPNSPAVHCTPVNLPCQFFRRIIAKEMGVPNQYDYNCNVFESNVLKTITQIQRISPYHQSKARAISHHG